MAGLWIVVAGLLTGLISYTNNKRFFGSLASSAAAAADGETVTTPPATCACNKD